MLVRSSLRTVKIYETSKKNGHVDICSTSTKNIGKQFIFLGQSKMHTRRCIKNTVKQLRWCILRK